MKRFPSTAAVVFLCAVIEAYYFLFTPWYVEVFPSGLRSADHPVFSVYNGTPITLRNISMGCKPRGARFGFEDVEAVTFVPEPEIDLPPGQTVSLSCLARQHDNNRFDYVLDYNIFFTREYKTMPFKIITKPGPSIIRDEPIAAHYALEYSGAR